MKLAAPQGLGDRGHCSGCNTPWIPNSLPPLIIPGQDDYLLLSEAVSATLPPAFSCKLPYFLGYLSTSPPKALGFAFAFTIHSTSNFRPRTTTFTELLVDITLLTVIHSTFWSGVVDGLRL